MKHGVKKMAFGGVSMSRLQELSKGSPAQAAVRKPAPPKEAIAKIQERIGRADDPDMKAALQRQIQRVSSRAPAAPIQSPGGRVTTMPVGKPIPVDLKSPTPAPGDRVTTMPVGKPIPVDLKSPTPVSTPDVRGGAPTQMIAKGGKAKEKKYASGGSAVSKRADGVAQRGKTKCKMY